MQCILYKIYFWKVFHMYYNLICILYALLCGQKNYSCKKWVLQRLSDKGIIGPTHGDESLEALDKDVLFLALMSSGSGGL
jgi:hypothetical protein